MTRDQAKEVLWAPLLIWAALMGLLALTFCYAYWPGAPLKTEVSLAISVAKALLIALFFMQLRQAAGLVRLAALTGLVWATFLYLFTFADLLTR